MPEAAAKQTWARVAFGDVVKLARERSSNPEEDGFERFVGLDHLDPGDLRIRRWGNIADGSTFTSVFRPGRVLFGKRRAYQRKVAVAEFSGVCSGDIYVFEPTDSHLLPELLPYICQSDGFFEHAIGTSAGSLSPRTNWESLAGYEFALPPLDEQRRITDLLHAADLASDALLDLVEAERVAELALFSDLLQRCGAHDMELAPLLAEAPRNGCSAVEASSPTGHWVLALSALTRSGYRRGELKPVEKTDSMSAVVLKEGDLLISRSNTRELVGLPGIFDENRLDVSWPDTMMKLTPDESQLRRRFLELFLRAPVGRKQVRSFAAGTSASMKKINGANVRRLLIPVPTVAMQDDIVSKTDAFRQARASGQERASELRELKRTLLRSALSPDTCETS